MSRRSRLYRAGHATRQPVVRVALNPSALPLNRRGPDVDVAIGLPLAEMPPEVMATMPGLPPGEYCRGFRLGDCSVIVTREFGRWHLSIAHPTRDPTWAEISQARYRILPDDAWMAIYLPPRSEYVNVHRFCFQMLEADPPPSGGVS